MKLPRWLIRSQSDDDRNPNPNLVNVGVQIYAVEPNRPLSEAAVGHNRPNPNEPGPSRPNPAGRDEAARPNPQGAAGRAGRTKDFAVQVELPPKGKTLIDKGTQTPKGTGDLIEAPVKKPPDTKPPDKPAAVAQKPRESPPKAAVMKPAVPVKPVAKPPGPASTPPTPAQAPTPAPPKKEDDYDSDDESSDVDSITKKNTNMNKVTPPPRPMLAQPEKKAPTGPRRGIRGIKNLDTNN